MARVDVLMPQMGESIAEGTLSKWLKKVGDEVKRDEPLFEISTDKVDAEIPAPTAGVLAEIKVQEGQTVPVQTLVAVLETEKGAAASAPAPAPAAPATAAKATPATATPAPAPAPKPAPSPAPAATAAASAPRAPVPANGDETAEERLRRRSTPLVRKIAAEHQVDISGIAGTGYAGRVTKQDILGYIERGVPAAAPLGAPRIPAGAPSGPIEHPAVEPWPGDRVEPWSRIRKITADHMIMSKRVSAHVASFFEVDFTRVAQLRAKAKASYQERGVNLTFLAFIAKAVAENLRQHPVVNAAVSGDNTIYRRDINLGIAVALDWGLIVPVVKHADELSLMGIARALSDLGERARTRKLLPDDIQRGTFTITNPGIFGDLIGIPIINQPQVAILGVGAIEKKPKVITQPDGTDTIAIRTMGMLSMSYDHRVVDGADGDKFLADVKKMLQEFPEGAI
ncbi:MAG TPA: 2-oxoglutarate dehydrogenase, E2 component, dihydrolipoamide succinyltransferase [Gemmatimonadales bacterium]|nr:2-oxoglutarate dehydrogenase, E2 component, dihydrolipoamide succinyltransferase [Gemmatimonadales bacterium]